MILFPYYFSAVEILHETQDPQNLKKSILPFEIWTASVSMIFQKFHYWSPW